MTPTLRAPLTGAAILVGGAAAAAEGIAAADPGGGWDFTRQIGKVIYAIGEVELPAAASRSGPPAARATTIPGSSPRPRTEPLVPRGRRGAHQMNDRRAISGIVQMPR